MAQYIDKSALVAEIEKWMTLLTKEKNQEGASKIDKLSLGGRIAELQEVKVFLDTLEVKEVDLDEEITIAMPHRYSWSGDGSTMLYTEEQMKYFAKHFFELGMRVSKADRGMAEEIIINLKRVEQDYRIDLTKEIEWVRNKSQKGKEV